MSLCRSHLFRRVTLRQVAVLGREPHRDLPATGSAAPRSDEAYQPSGRGRSSDAASPALRTVTLSRRTLSDCKEKGVVQWHYPLRFDQATWPSAPRAIPASQWARSALTLPASGRGRPEPRRWSAVWWPLADADDPKAR